MTKSTCPAPSDEQPVDVDAFVAECLAFCAAHNCSMLTLSQRALKGTYAISRLPVTAKKLERRIALVRATMKEIAEAKAAKTRRE